MSTSNELRFAPFRPLSEFITNATWNVPNFSDLPKLNNRIISNLIYYQTNYFVFGIALFLLVGINYPVDFLFGLVVVSALLMGFVYISSSARANNNNVLATVEHFLRSAKEDRPIIVFVAVLGASYFILSFLGKLFIFFLGIVLPVQAILLHATLCRRNMSNKVTNKISQLSLHGTPMGVFLAALGLQVVMSNSEHQFRIPPIRSIREFIGGNEWAKPSFNPNELRELEKQVIANMIYYQSNYGAIAIPFILLVAFFYPAAIVFGFFILAALLAGFVYTQKQRTALTVLFHDRPILVLIILLFAAFLVIRMFGTVFIFLLGIALPLSLIVGHATARTQTLQNKAENAVESLSLQATPMGLLLSWLGAKPTEESTTKRR
ncbi:unnamed protein product [Adineta ricciae]|uniref:PRA1 family protein n=1 Tax=Adineta ricciae TaxID=249248 RepID=A0A814S8U0_ADIRI|nr:unnamed protein product [Adineta ricciae]CAF1350150.1 unnamed protein product [Adineta ricciae]